MIVNNFKINYFGSAVPFNPDDLPERSDVTGQGSQRPIGFTLEEITELYWTVKSFQVDVSVIDMNIDPLTLFLSAGGGAGGIIGATAGLATVGLSLAASILGGVKGRTRVNSYYERKNRKCKTNPALEFGYDNQGNILDIKGCGPEAGRTIPTLIVEEKFLALDSDVDEARLCVAGPVHRLPSRNGQGYVEINFTDIIFAKRLYWPIIKILMGNGESILTSDILSLGPNQNNYNIGAVIFGTYGTIQMSGYSTKNLQPVFYSVGGRIRIGERCCDKFYFDGFDRGSQDDPCFIECNRDDNESRNTGTTATSDEGRFVGGGGRSGGGGAGGSW